MQTFEQYVLSDSAPAGCVHFIQLRVIYSTYAKNDGVANRLEEGCDCEGLQPESPRHPAERNAMRTLEKRLDLPRSGEQSKRGRTYEDETWERPRADHMGEAPFVRCVHGGSDDVRHRRSRVAAEDGTGGGRSGYLHTARHHDG